MTSEEKVRAYEIKIKQLRNELDRYKKIAERLSLLDNRANEYIMRGRFSSYIPLAIKVHELQAAGFNNVEISNMLNVDKNKIYRAINYMKRIKESKPQNEPKKGHIEY